MKATVSKDNGVENQRIRNLNTQSFNHGKYILYWMQASQRVVDNHALAFAVDMAHTKQMPLVVFFGLTDDFPDANYRHYQFMLQGLQEVQRNLEQLGISFILRHISPELGAIELSSDASMLVVDKGYLRIQRQWRKKVASQIHCPCIQVESDVVVPVELASQKEEYSAATFRPKISKLVKRFLVPISSLEPVKHSISSELDTLSLSNLSSVLKLLDVDKTVPASSEFYGGTSQGLQRVHDFIKKHLAEYENNKNDPSKNCVSNVSPYLHFGQLSPLTIALAIQKEKTPGSESYLEELIVRRELSINFAYYNQNYDSYESLPSWCQQTLSHHSKDKRPYTYSLDEFEHAQTHDPYWNAAQLQMISTGKMHGYMRMYWGKKIIEWTSSPQEAYRIALYLNNKFELDGRDPNGFTGVAWCFGKHDRPWVKRTIFGKIRYMNAKGLERKFNIEQYAKAYRQ